jgi:hypothetical protein
MSTSDRESMIEPADPSKRRRWKRRTIALLVIALLSDAIRKARQLRIGMTYAEVLAIMGHPNVTTTARPAPPPVPENAYFGDMGRAYKDGLLLWLRMKTGFDIPMSDLSSWPVHVRFDTKGCADRIRRGDEVVELPASSTQ